MIPPNKQCPFQSDEKLNQYGKIFGSATQNVFNQIVHRILGLSVQGLVSRIIKHEAKVSAIFALRPHPRVIVFFKILL